MWEAIVNATEFLWGTPLMILMVGVGLYLTVRTRFFQITGIGTWMKRTIGELFKKQDSESSAGRAATGDGISVPVVSETTRSYFLDFPLHSKEGAASRFETAPFVIPRCSAYLSLTYALIDRGYFSTPLNSLRFFR